MNVSGISSMSVANVIYVCAFLYLINSKPESYTDQPRFLYAGLGKLLIILNW